MTAGLALAGITKVLGGRTIVDHLDLDVGQGELVCLLGPSGCGKTTTLRMIGGFLEPDAGRLLINGVDHTWSRPERRPTAMVFQNYALWPHMTVAKNVAFGLKIRKLPAKAITEKVDWALDLLSLSHHRNSMPARISGGEQQRVALARALVLEPEVLLMDEPLSNLDAKLRVSVRETIKQIQQRLGITTVFVTHDQEEALSIADRVAVMSGGRIEQLAPPAELYRLPRTSFVAGFVGSMNTLEVAPDPAGSGVPLADGSLLPVDMLSGRHGDACWIRPEDLQIRPEADPGTTRAVVLRVIPRGHYQEVLLQCHGTALRSFTDADPDAEQIVGVKASKALVYADGLLVSDNAVLDEGDSGRPPRARDDSTTGGVQAGQSSHPSVSGGAESSTAESSTADRSTAESSTAAAARSDNPGGASAPAAARSDLDDAS